MTSGAVIFVKDVARVARFYQQLVPMAVTHEEEGLCVLSSASVELVIHAIPQQYAEGIEIAVPPVAREDSYLKLFFPCRDLAAARVAAAQLGGYLQPPDKEWEARGFRACDGVDPEGNIIQLRQPVPTPTA